MNSRKLLLVASRSFSPAPRPSSPAPPSPPPRRRPGPLRQLRHRPRRPRHDRCSRATISTATPTAPGCGPRRSRPTAPAGACGPSLSEDIERQVRAIVTEAATSRDPAQRQVGDFYAAWMDEAGIEARGTAPLRPYLAAHRRHPQPRRSDRALRRRRATCAPVGVGIIPDLADPTRYIAIAGQGGLGMPNRDYYLREGEQYDALSAPPIAPMSSRCSSSPASPTPRPRPTASSRSRRRIAEVALGAGAQPRHPGDLQSDEPRPARRAGAAVRMADATSQRARPRLGHRP